MAYKDISRGVRLAADHAKYMTWLQKDTEARQTAYAAITTAANKVKTDRVAGAIIPFDTSGINLVYIPARLISPTQTGRGAELAKKLQTIVAEYTFTTAELAALTTPNIIDNVHKFKFAKLTVIQRITTATTKEASRITGRQYYRHENDSVTTNFGKKEASNTYDTVVTAIKGQTAFTGLFSGSENALASRYRFKPEGV
ncbi:hypothetical protein [Nostoc sp. 'Lobaria pulmonaria (5183) cyanobiont']|uniref:hypothetical protein n=1 Tax=Nostoc sp. 'Lobaria pulmonaria (5183) cyanobiont' TaxID=1618022 RepID=UPI000CF34402|nr:hypothetical protein [Nostoc sp. 'Lobaria pulmonaria (5183) cyanobiont']AVH71587.1 hypothetical protein NLP_2997 [Nostoc sp. 'Lobaria pulmonaria (5183) cyanobiont']